MLSSLATLAVSLLLAPAALAAPADAAAAATAAKKCPETFAIYLGTGNDAQNRTWWFRELEPGRAMQLSAVDWAVSGFKLKGTSIVNADNSSVALYSYNDDETFIMPATPEIIAQHNATGLLAPIVARINPATCIIDMHYKKNKYLQRYGFYVHLTPDKTGGQIQWPAPTARPVPAASQDNTQSAAAVSTNAKVVKPQHSVPCEEAYYLEPCPKL